MPGHPSMTPNWARLLHTGRARHLSKAGSLSLIGGVVPDVASNLWIPPFGSRFIRYCLMEIMTSPFPKAVQTAAPASSCASATTQSMRIRVWSPFGRLGSYTQRYFVVLVLFKITSRLPLDRILRTWSGRGRLGVA